MSRALTAISLLCALAATACGETTDHLGARRLTKLNPLTPPASYPTPLLDRGKTQQEIDKQIDGAFQYLFGDPNTAIYAPVGDDEGVIVDTYHDNDVRTEGLGLGMMLAVQLNHQDEFDRLWTYAKREQRVESGAAAGYFKSNCEQQTTSSPCLDPFGLEQFTMALIFAKTRFADSPSAIDYEADAIELLELMREKEARNGGVVDGVSNTFDSATYLIYNVPNGQKITRPSIEIPAYYKLWAEATGDPFWLRAADAAHTHLTNSAAGNGLLPLRTDFNGKAVSGYDYFDSECFRAHLNLAIDHAWFGPSADTKPEANSLLNFFATAPNQIDSYGAAFYLDGSVRDGNHDPALVAINGALAIAAIKNQYQDAFITESWKLALPVGKTRYYIGLLELLSWSLLAGEYKVW